MLQSTASRPLLCFSVKMTCEAVKRLVAALTWALDRGDDQVRAGQLATAAAGLVVRHPGGRPLIDAATVEEWADRLAADR